MPLSFGNKIKEARKAKNLTQKELANLVGAKHNSISDWENDKNKPDPDTIELLCGILEVTPNYLLASSSEDFSPAEKLLVKKYRSLSEDGQEAVSYILDREVSLEKRIAELESKPDNIIEFTPSPDDTDRLVEYFNSASAGTGIFIMGNEATEQLPIPDTKENKKVDYAIKVSGNSMEPDFYDGDIALVSHREELNYGDVGIFIINNNAYIKEYGEKELISRNPKADNIMIEEYDNIVCMGKVIGKL